MVTFQKKRGMALFAVVLVMMLLCAVCVQAQQVPPEEISAQAYVLLEAQSGTVLCSRNETQTLPMASTTKIMTALLTLEHGGLDESFTVDAESIQVEGSSMGLLAGDTVTLRDLCYGMLLASGNDAANLAAVRVAGSVEAFADLMNERAKQIGMSSTHFVTPSGLHNEEHYSTAYDMALLAREALNNPEFAEICGCSKAKRSFGNPPYTRWMTNHNKLLTFYEGCIGVKTGFTKMAGRCLVSAAERNGVRLIAVTLNAPNDWQDHTKLLDYGFSCVPSAPVTLPAVEGQTASVVGGVKDTVTAVASSEPQLFLNEEEAAKVQTRILLRPFYYAPVRQGDVLGCVEYVLDGRVVASVDLTAAEDVEKQSGGAGSESLWGKLKYYVGVLLKAPEDASCFLMMERIS